MKKNVLIKAITIFTFSIALLIISHTVHVSINTNLEDIAFETKDIFDSPHLLKESFEPIHPPVLKH